MEYLIGTVEENLGVLNTQKFIIEKKNDSLVYHARALVDDEEPYHKDIARLVGAAKVIGGGRAGLLKGRFSIYGRSCSYGPVSGKIMNQFKDKLVKKYKEILPCLEDVIFCTE